MSYVDSVCFHLHLSMCGPPVVLAGPVLGDWHHSHSLALESPAHIRTWTPMVLAALCTVIGPGLADSLASVLTVAHSVTICDLVAHARRQAGCLDAAHLQLLVFNSTGNHCCHVFTESAC